MKNIKKSLKQMETLFFILKNSIIELAEFC